MTTTCTDGGHLLILISSQKFCMLKKFSVFVIVGLISTVADLLFLWLMVAWGAAHSAAVSLAFGLALLVNLALQARFTFKSSLSPERIVKFLALAAINYLLTVTAVSTFEWLTLSLMWGKLVSLPIVALNSFFFSKYWVYKQ